MFQLGRSTLDDYLNRIAKNCGKEYINGVEVWQLADDDASLAGDEDYFPGSGVDAALWHDHPGAVESRYQRLFTTTTARGQRAYNCIISQLPSQVPALQALQESL